MSTNFQVSQTHDHRGQIHPVVEAPQVMEMPSNLVESLTADVCSRDMAVYV